MKNMFQNIREKFLTEEQCYNLVEGSGIEDMDAKVLHFSPRVLSGWSRYNLYHMGRFNEVQTMLFEETFVLSVEDWTESKAAAVAKHEAKLAEEARVLAAEREAKAAEQRKADQEAMRRWNEQRRKDDAEARRFGFRDYQELIIDVNRMGEICRLHPDGFYGRLRDCEETTQYLVETFYKGPRDLTLLERCQGRQRERLYYDDEDGWGSADEDDYYEEPSFGAKAGATLLGVVFGYKASKALRDR